MWAGCPNFSLQVRYNGEYFKLNFPCGSLFTAFIVTQCSPVQKYCDFFLSLLLLLKVFCLNVSSDFPVRYQQKSPSLSQSAACFLGDPLSMISVPNLI